MSWPKASDVEAWRELADPAGEWMVERVAIKADGEDLGGRDLAEEARQELREQWRAVKAREEGLATSEGKVSLKKSEAASFLSRTARTRMASPRPKENTCTES